MALGGLVSAVRRHASKYRELHVMVLQAEHLTQVFKLADLGPNDVVCDVGSGDGRIPIWAVAVCGAASATG